MADGSDNDSFESRVGSALDKIDEASKKLESSIKQKLDRRKSEKESVAIEIDHDDEQSDQGSTLSKAREGMGNVGSRISTTVEKANISGKATGIGNSAKGAGGAIYSVLRRVGSYLPYIIPATVVFQTSLWLAYLSEGSVSHDIVGPIADGLSESGRNIAILVSIFGAIGAYLISSTFDSSLDFGEFSIMVDVADVMVVILALSSVLYLLKKFQSLYYLAVVFIGSFAVRVIDVQGLSYDWSSVISMTIGLVGFFSVLSLPLYRERVIRRKEDSEIDTSLLIDSVDDSAESSYLDTRVGDLGSYMEQAPVTKPRRPSRRSEYELYEWVLLLANLILWPSVVIISVILGSGTEVAGDTYNLDENYLMLLGPLMLTLFFFFMLYKMDANARDGSLYAAEKQSYLDEMDKYLEARTAYLELVTLQAQNKKQEILDGSSEE